MYLVMSGDSQQPGLQGQVYPLLRHWLLIGSSSNAKSSAATWVSCDVEALMVINKDSHIQVHECASSKDHLSEGQMQEGALHSIQPWATTSEPRCRVCS